MAVGILGTKLGMTQIFDQETGLAIPVTVVQAGPCTVTQIKTSETDGYSAIQVGYSEVKEKALTKAELGHLKKNDVPPLRHLREYRLDTPNQYQLGDAIKADIFNTGDLVDIAGKSIGRGFAGYQKRHNFKRGN
ncbi:MAG: 50S ribosomal protein L3, partial [cyanobacterium endosymbiont of Rhopalodia yunnanensis]